MKTRNKKDNNVWSDEKQLKKNSFLLMENYDVTEKELEECRQIIENLRQRSQSSSAQ